MQTSLRAAVLTKREKVSKPDGRTKSGWRSEEKDIPYVALPDGTELYSPPAVYQNAKYACVMYAQGWNEAMERIGDYAN